MALGNENESARLRPDRWHGAADEMRAALQQAYEAAQCDDASSLITAASALLGEAALLCCERRLPPQGWVNSASASAMLYGRIGSGPCLWGYIAAALIQGYGAQPAHMPDVNDAQARAAAGLGLQPFPPLSAPTQYLPAADPALAGPMHRAAIHRIAHSHGLGPVDTVYAIATVIIKQIGASRDVLPMTISARLALETMVSMARLAPPPVIAPEQGALSA